METEECQKVINFVKENTKQFDASHDLQHALKVAKNTIKILNRKDVLYLALLHDVCDHKYPESMLRKDLSEWINSNLEEYKYIDNLIDKVSFSYQQKNMNEKINPELQLILDVVRDADRLESLGHVGVERLELYSKRINRSQEDCIQYCFDKLLRLVPEKYIKIVTPEVIDAHNVIVDYVNLHTNKNILKL